MACYTPLQAWYSKEINTSGKRSLVFTHIYALEPDNPITIACGQCIGCRLEKSRQWAIRCIHESSLYEDNCFITLTFSPGVLQKRENPWSIDVRDYQLFMKKLRKKYGKGIRFFHCGEYGEKGGRPHYHALLFNFDFKDKELWKIENNQRYYISNELNNLWGKGHCVIGNVTFESAAYVARYVMKKVNGEEKDAHYQWADSETGEVFPLKPEYVTMSRRPGIVKKWYDKYHSDLYPKDYITVNGKKCRPPKYYDNILKEANPISFDKIHEARQEKILDRQDELTPSRLKIKEQIANRKLDRLLRSHDKDTL